MRGRREEGGENNKNALAGQWRCMPVISALGRPRKADGCEFEGSLVYVVTSKTSRTAQCNPVSNNTHKRMHFVHV